LSGSATTGVPTKPVSQTFNILDLSTIWLPAAFEAGSVHVNEAEDVDVRWDDVSSTLIVPTDLDTSDGLRYEVVSDIPTFDPAGLVGIGDVPRDIAERNRDLPSDFPPAVTDLARSIVAGASTPYEQALALQNSFRDGSFTYSLAAAPGHSESAIENFLFVTRTGYCEQFAGAFAAMARAVGLPARVAVGFTPGDRDPADPSRYIVRGEHAHAWPEVWIPGAGWVAFEPTPGRGAPGARAYTGVEESQDTAGLSTEPTTVPEAAPGPDDTLPEDGGAGASTTVPPLGDVGAELPPIEPPEDDSVFPSASRLALGIAIALPALLVVLGGVGSIVAGTRALRRHRWRARAESPEDRVRADGRAVLDYVGVLGIVRRPFETHAEFGRRLAALVGEPAAVRLGELLTRADFDPAGVSEEDAEEADTIVAAIHDAVRVRTTRWQRARAAMDPRSAERRARARGPRPTGPRIQISTAGTGR
jgi:transglutaminase-like putative cysteine protease